MKIEFYPTLGQALETLKRGEVLYTNSWFVLNPVRIWYGKDTVWHMEGSIEYEQTQYVPRVIEEERLTISDKLRLEAKKKSKKDDSIQERGLYAVEKGKKEKISEDVKDLYNYYCFRKEEIEEIIEDLISSSEKNSGVFKEPLRRAIALGLGEVKNKIKNKDLILVGNMPSHLFEEAKELRVLDHLMEHLRNPILMALEEEEEKKEFSEAFKEFWEKNFLDIARRVEDVISERIKYVNEIEKRRHGLHGDEEDYFWHEVIEVVDKELGIGKGRITGDVWEKGRILGLEFGGVRKLEDQVYKAKKELEKMGKNYEEEVFPEVLGSISIYLPTMPKPENAEVVIVPYGIRDKNRDKEIEFLTLVKIRVKDIEFKCGQAHTQETEKHISIQAVPQHYMRIVSREEVPEEIRESKGKILIKPTYSEYIDIINKHVWEKSRVETELKSMKKQALLRSVRYRAETGGLNKSLVIDVEVEGVDRPSIVVRNYHQLKESKSVSEEITIEAFLSKSISPNMEEEKKEGAGCLGGDKVDKIIKEELEQLAEEIREYAKEETRKKEKTSFESASIVAKRASEVLGRGNIAHGKCSKAYKSNLYTYKIVPKIVEGYKPIIEDKEIVEPLRRCCNPLITKKYEILFKLFSHKEKEKLCFESGGEKAKVRIGEIEKIIRGEEKEIVYITKFSEELLKLFFDYLNKVTSENPHSEYKHNMDIGEIEALNRMPNEEEIRETNNLSLLLSGSIAASMLIPWEEKFPLIRGKKEEDMIGIVGKLYKIILIMLTGGAYKYVEKNEYWSKQKIKIFWLKKIGNKPTINEKELLKEMLGVVIKMRVTEGIEVSIPEYGGKGKFGPEWERSIDLLTYYEMNLLGYKENPVTFYLETGKEGKALEIKPNIYTEYS
jgi:hypothetical protein